MSFPIMCKFPEYTIVIHVLLCWFYDAKNLFLSEAQYDQWKKRKMKAKLRSIEHSYDILQLLFPLLDFISASIF